MEQVSYQPGVLLSINRQCQVSAGNSKHWCQSVKNHLLNLIFSWPIDWLVTVTVSVLQCQDDATQTAQKSVKTSTKIKLLTWLSDSVAVKHENVIKIMCIVIQMTPLQHLADAGVHRWCYAMTSYCNTNISSPTQSIALSTARIYQYFTAWLAVLIISSTFYPCWA